MTPEAGKELAHLLFVQDGVVARRQLLAEVGLNANDIRRMLRRGELVVVHPGVYVVHNGPLTWDQRAWAAVLAHWPAALTRESALPSPPVKAPIQVAIDLRRTVRPIRGVRAHRTPGLQERADWRKRPPRVRLEHAALDGAAAVEDPVEAFHVLAATCGRRETSW